MRLDRGPGWTGVFVLMAVLAGPGALYGQGSCVQLTGGCSAGAHPSQCFPDALGPISWQDLAGYRTRQVRTLANSPQSSCHPPVGIGAPPVCCSPFHPPRCGWTETGTPSSAGTGP